MTSSGSAFPLIGCTAISSLGAVSGSWDAPFVSELRGLPESGTVISYSETIPPGDNGSEGGLAVHSCGEVRSSSLA